MRNKPTYAIQPPGTPVTLINDELLAEVVNASRISPRKRMILPLHKEGDDLLQRMLNALQPGSYIRPHRHASDRGESLIVLRGVLIYFTFNEQGTLESTTQLEAGSAQFGIDIEGGVWHSFAAAEPDTVLFEVKPGPYNEEADKEFAAWAPEESSPEANAYLEALLQNSTTS